MGLFDFFRRKRTGEEAMEKITNELLSKLFPGGKEEIETQVQELQSLLKQTYPSSGIEGTLKYMTTLFAISQDKSEDRIVYNGAMKRPNNKFTSEDLKTIYKFVITKHLLKTLGRCDDEIFNYFYASIGNYEGGAKTDVIANAFGEYGLCETNPIPVKGIPASEIYLKKLRLENGEKIQWYRIGSTGAENIKGSIDMYSIKTLSGEEICIIYISPYQSVISQKAPKGFIIG